MPPHNTAVAPLPLRQALTRSVADECGATRAVPFNAEARAYEAFGFGAAGTYLLDPLEAASLDEALAETTQRWTWDRGQRLAIRELGPHRYPFERVGLDQLHIYAVRRKSVGSQVWRGHVPTLEYRRWLEHICTVDLNVLAGLPIGAVGCEIDMHEHRQRMRPEGARR